ncbi:methyltransferase family protein [Avibacterium sp. 21-599]|uniref:methyltransferase family protein n=1 Tax=Avibacterium sp. 21-599 TaxID=2911528 RepID=UPI00224509CE|nr:isoprenylcysteine carboxylmethyltransferase family protein [Avibacterium sp. 21-599]MCW9718838.1 isoprenylcysteine carboxylmethyltransferase family protein [Avibacterium sp. 21-599]
MELKFPPPLVMLFCGLCMGLVAWLPFGQILRLPWLAVIVALLAVLIGVMSVTSFKKAKTTISPVNPEKSSSLVTSGIFGISRNPMYLSMALLLTALALVLGSVFAWFFVLGFILYMNRFQIIPEERILAQKFGEVYQAYCQQTRRWL